MGLGATSHEIQHFEFEKYGKLKKIYPPLIESMVVQQKRKHVIIPLV